MEFVPVKEPDWSVGIAATIHTCGNGFIYNPHVHPIGTSDLVNTDTGEVNNLDFMQFKRIRFSWMDVACRLFRKFDMFTDGEITAIKERYANGFMFTLNRLAARKAK